MRIEIKAITVGNKVSKMSLEHNPTESSVDNFNEVKALAILLGDYNAMGRSIDYETFKEIQSRFYDCINEIKELLP